jgi:hypothetical protein
VAPRKGLKVADYQRLADQGYSKSEAARLLGVRVQTVHMVAVKNRITFMMGYRRKEKRDALAIQQAAAE